MTEKTHRISGTIKRVITQTKHVTVDYTPSEGEDVSEWAKSHGESGKYHNLGDFNEWGEVRIKTCFDPEPEIEELDKDGKVVRRVKGPDKSTADKKISTNQTASKPSDPRRPPFSTADR